MSTIIVQDKFNEQTYQPYLAIKFEIEAYPETIDDMRFSGVADPEKEFLILLVAEYQTALEKALKESPLFRIKLAELNQSLYDVDSSKENDLGPT